MEGDDEAAQREAIAARMRGGDYTGARTLLLETLQTNPRLDSAFEMLSVLEVLCVAGRPLQGRGAVDWYRVLQVLPGDDAARIEAQYRSIVAQLESAGDGLPGAELALWLVNDAYAVLSDPAKRARFDSRNTADAIKQITTGASTSNAHVELRCDASLAKGVHIEGAALLSGANPELERLNIMGSKYIQHTDGPCLDVGDCSNIASSSKTKRTDPCFLGDDGELQLPEENHVDKKQKSVCEKDVYCVSSSQVDLDGCFVDLSGAKQDENCSDMHG